MLRTIRQITERKRTAAKLYAAISARAREQAFYLDYRVPDTFDGRFDVLVLHAWLVLDRLGRQDPLAQDLVDAIFARLEDALREQGMGDIGISRRMKTIASAFYGRLNAYRDSTDEAALAQALLRNVYREAPQRVEHAVRFAKYVAGARAGLLESRAERGELSFGVLPAEV